MGNKKSSMVEETSQISEDRRLGSGGMGENKVTSGTALYHQYFQCFIDITDL